MWRQRIEAALAPDVPVADDLPASDARRARHATRPAAVLIGIEATATPRILFTERSHALRHHPGQISFPGGRLDAGDAGPADAALRECHEEIGLARTAVELMGRLPTYRTVTGFEISPFVGWVEPGQPLEPDGVEVARIFRVPMAYAMDATHYRSEVLQRNGIDYRIYSIDFEGDHIWGATAAMLMGLAQRVAAVEGQPFAVPATAAPTRHALD
ncbi:CoA pyrophosphatase [Salinisphaera hydrothermalis]|uniref:NTP pyrophosphohydrolase, NUDIX family protein n=1 Tax=Salinisphaera hydrothermalis (strain C41B8) TaxID=1304275 RepID=A0A084IQC9_SALHC|nr:CoA pyrophosphatase [Salinisphaera hydrothermalis]KEZ78913.1 NTP pyrophosphohydrolase, NUDIX family protein [Salinisphaera hydrothermalis C41B8]